MIADSIELVARGHLFDAVVALSACDKTIPGTVMALARLDVPSLMLYSGSIPPGHYNGKDVTIMDVFEAVGAHAAGKITDEELTALEDVASPGAGACGGQFTANTMAMAFQMLGISPMGPSDIPAQDQTKAQAAYDAGVLVMDVLARGQRPSDIITHDALENAIAAIAMSGGSTNGVLHLLAVAREAGLELSIDDFDRIASRTPLLCDLKPGGRFVATDMHAAGGTAVVAARLLGGRPAARGRADRPRPDDRRARPRGPGDARPGGRQAARQPAQAHRRHRHPARQPRARGLRREAVGPRARPPRRPGARVRGRGSARWRPSRTGRSSPATSSSSATRARPAAPACARCWPSPRRSWGRGSATPSPCSPTAASPAPRAASWSATSPPRPSTAARSRPSQDGDTITIDVKNRRLDVDLPDDEIARRVEAYESPDPVKGNGVLAKYAKLVSSASEGAVTR